MSLTHSTRPVQDVSDPPRGTELSCRLQCLHSPGGQVTVLCLAGELDISTRPYAAAALGTALGQAWGPLVVDLAALTFCSASGLGLLGGPTGTAGGDAYVLVGLSPQLRRVATVLWPAGYPLRYPSIAAAVTALQAMQPARQGGEPSGGVRCPG